MITNLTYYHILLYFLIYSFLGWVLEVIFHAVSFGKVINRGFLNGPICPVYGSCITLILMINEYFNTNSVQQASLPVLFIGGVLLATLIELLAGVLLNVFFHARWWDYSDKPFNFKGYICLEFSLIWGVAITFVMHILQPGIEQNIVNRIPQSYGWPILLILYVIFFVDLGVTIASVIGMNKKLAQLNELQAKLRIVSDELSQKIGTKALHTSQKIGEAQVQAKLASAELHDFMEENLQEALRRRENLQAQFEKLQNNFARHKHLGSNRLLKAFPNLKHNTYAEILAQLKIEIDKRHHNT